jgi:hypothetical protein
VHALERRAQFPAPDAQGNFNNTQIEALQNNNSQADNALHQCRSVLPNAGTGLTVEQIQEIQQQNLRNAVKAAHCMRARGSRTSPTRRERHRQPASTGRQ